MEPFDLVLSSLQPLLLDNSISQSASFRRLMQSVAGSEGGVDF